MAANNQLTFVNLLFVPPAVGIIILHKVRFKRVLSKSPQQTYAVELIGFVW